MRVFSWAASAGGSYSYRLDYPARVLRRLGHTVDVAEFALASVAARADVTVGQWVSKPGPSSRWREWAGMGRFLVYDVDDRLDCVDPLSRQAFEFYSQPSVQADIAANMAAASRVVAATPALADWASRHSDEVVVVPNGLPAELLEVPRPARVDDRVVVGWAGSPQTLPELALVARTLRRLVESMPDRVEVHTVGVPREWLARLGLDLPGVRVTPWVFGTEQYLSTVDFDVWVAPYRDIPFNRAKVPTKALEARLLGVPLVASDVGGYPGMVLHGETGFVVRREHEWGQLVRRLVVDDGLRAAMAARARSLAFEVLVEGLGRRWEEALTPPTVQ